MRWLRQEPGNSDGRQVELIEGGSGARGEVVESLKIQSPKSVAQIVVLNGMAIN